MNSRKRWIVSSLTGLLLTAVAGLSYGAASEEAAAGVKMAASDEAAPARQSKIKLVLDRDGDTERLALENLHEMAVGESRTLATENGTPVVVTRDADGFEIDLAGKKIRLDEPFAADEPGTIHRRIVVQHGAEGEDGASNIVILRNKVTAGEGGAVVSESAGATGGADVVVVRKKSADSHAFAFATDGGELPAMPLPIEATVRRLEASAKFQALDAATRATVLEALRESAPKAGAFVAGEPGTRTMVLEIEDEDTPGDPH